jgi:hypothetical protein
MGRGTSRIALRTASLVHLRSYLQSDEQQRIAINPSLIQGSGVVATVKSPNLKLSGACQGA